MTFPDQPFPLPSRSKHPKLMRAVPWLVGFAMVAVVVVVVLHFGEERQIAKLVQQAEPLWLILGALLQFGTYVADAGIWLQVTLRGGEHRPLRSFVGLSLTKLFMDQAIPTGGISGVMLMIGGLERRGIARGTIMAGAFIAVFTEYVSYGLALAVGLLIVAAHGELNSSILAASVTCSVFILGVPILLVFLVRRGKGRLLLWLERLPIIRRVLPVLREATPALTHDRRLIAGCMACQLTIFLLDTATMWLMLQALGVDVPPTAVFSAFMLASLARTVGFTPGGIGTFEAASVGALRLMGVPAVVGLSATLLFRALSFWLPMLPGLILARHESRRR